MAPARPNCCPNVIGSLHRRPPATPATTRHLSRRPSSSTTSTSTSAAAFAAAGPNGSDGDFVIGSGALSLEEILSRARASLDPTEGSGSGSESESGGRGNEAGGRRRHVLLSGDGRHLGSDVSWKLLLDLEGAGAGGGRIGEEEQQLAFREDVGGDNLSFSWGYSGGGGKEDREIPSSSSSPSA